MRHHVGLSTTNSPKCFIDVDVEAVMFDETCIHIAANETDHQRIILFCDVERPAYTKVVELLNRWFGRYVMSAASSQNVEGKKAKHHTVYYVGKWMLILGILWAIFW